MLAPRAIRYVFFPLMLLAMSLLAWPAFVVLREGVAAGSGEAWMVLWVLAFVFALPALMLVLPFVAALVELARGRDNIPSAGVKIP
ncbi:hypothetical protein [Marilutibacter alkalisoli]|uniref:hypothetical protein n=1 Tax=Marilutibacter alkalisoli TaxID=2591633 RepID=UPI00141E7D07|nr:hypothetical protein [Lysobacter alkalisoli]